MMSFESHVEIGRCRQWRRLIVMGYCLSTVLELNAFVCGVDSLPAAQGSPHHEFLSLGERYSIGETGAVSSQGQKRLLLLRVDFEDWPGDPLDDVAASNLLQGLSDFFQSVSKGRMELAAPGGASPMESQFTMTLRMPRAASFYGTNLLHELLRADARAAAQMAGWSVDEFDLDMVCMGRIPGFTWTGLGNIGSAGVWLRGQFPLALAAHELGHNLGLRHANFWDTAGASIVGPGIEVEYGDIFDAMGTGASSLEFNTREKTWLGWLDTEERFEIVSNGVYRIYAHDSPASAGLPQALVVAGLSGTNYWLEHRQHTTLSPWSSQGVQVRQAGLGNQSTRLLDMTPDSPEGRFDCPLLIGKTFSDGALGLHVTPLSLGGTFPESVDIMVIRGAFLTNLPPVVTLSVGQTNASVGQPLTWEVVATDPNGDPLAYAWDFGDGAYAGNRTLVEHAWVVPGEYVVRCEVSDMRGGRASASLIVRVGSPDTFRISGIIRTEAGEPVEGVTVRTSPDLRTWTTSSGRYDLVGLGPGAYEVRAVLYGYKFDPRDFGNPVVVGPHADHVNFVAIPFTDQLYVPLVPAGSTWRFLDDGSDQETAWRELAFDDRSWSWGPGTFGYGDGDEATLIDFGAFPNNKHITTYFRHRFNLTSLANVGLLRLGLMRDDGALVYLNGVEIWRSNMPQGPTDYRTRAVTTVGSTSERTFYSTNLLPHWLQAGDNLVAVEIHQQGRDSSDMRFDLFLNAGDLSVLPVGTSLAIAGGDSAWRAKEPLELFAQAWAGSTDPVERVEFWAQETKLGQSTNRPFAFTWLNPLMGSRELFTRAITQSGIILTSAPVRVTVRDVLIPRGAEWRYFDRGLDLGSSWTDPTFDDGDWAYGRAELGYGDGDEATVVSSGPDPDRQAITTYFRRSFAVASPAAYTNLVCRLLRDDAALVWLNGVEQWRSNLPLLGSIDFFTTAVEGIGDEEEKVFHERNLDVSGLREGSNVLAIEVHQRSASSSDISFDLEFLAEGPGEPVAPRIALHWLDRSLRISWPDQEQAWVLVEADELQGDWREVGELPAMQRGIQEVELPLDLDSGRRFFRLERRTQTP